MGLPTIGDRAKEWEAKYNEMQRQMSDVENSRYRIHSLIIDKVPKKATSEFEGKFVFIFQKEWAD